MFEHNNVFYHDLVHREGLVMGTFSTTVCGAKFMFNCVNHSLRSLSNDTFPLFWKEWDLDRKYVCEAWDNNGDIVIGNNVWIGDGAVVVVRAVVKKDVAPYTIVDSVPAREIHKRFDPDVVGRLLELKWWDGFRHRLLLVASLCG